MALAVLFVIVVALPVLFYSFYAFDRIVRAEYETNKIAWEADGKPYGFFGQRRRAHSCEVLGQGTAWLLSAIQDPVMGGRFSASQAMAEAPSNLCLGMERLNHIYLFRAGWKMTKTKEANLPRSDTRAQRMSAVTSV